MYKKHYKRWLDVFISSIAIVICMPVYIIIAILVKVRIGSPVLFCQKRPGKHEEIFTLYKFRTMTNERDENGILLSDSKRITKFGRWLRQSSLDELPELFNILKGDMSIVGPRPLLVSYIKRYNKKQRHRHDVQPGLTGLAQVKGRNLLTWEEKFHYDLLYVKNISFFLDIKIIFLTIIKVLMKEGVNQEGAATMTELLGNDKKSSEKEKYFI